jgi:hypothetical protein
MAKRHSSFDYETLVRFMLPNGILDYFEITKIDEEVTNEKDETGTVIRILHIYLDERDNRQGEELGFVANGFTEESIIHDYPARSRKMVLHVRRRRYKDADGHNVILCNYPLAAEGTRLSVEFGHFFKDGLG